MLSLCDLGEWTICSSRCINGRHADVVYNGSTCARASSVIVYCLCSNGNTTHHSLQFYNRCFLARSSLTIREWCSQQDPLAVISRYVALDKKGMGCCPFGMHHDDGVDAYPSLRVYRPSSPDICCWYCHTWKQGGSVFDFLRYYYGLSARDLWSHILAGGQF